MWLLTIFTKLSSFSCAVRIDCRSNGYDDSLFSDAVISMSLSESNPSSVKIYNTNNGKLEDFSLTKRKHFLGISTLLCVMNKRSHEKLMCAVCVPTL